MSKEWFILQFKANSHYQAAKNLNQQGFKTFLPLHDTTTRKVSRFKSTTQPLFPGYMFISFDREKFEWNKINNTYGVSRLITSNAVLKSVPSTIVDEFMSRCDLSGRIQPADKLVKGNTVKILEGPFANFIATVETYETDQRIFILMDLMGRETKIQAPLKSLQLST